jgi:hypothetical protein
MVHLKRFSPLHKIYEVVTSEITNQLTCFRQFHWHSYIMDGCYNETIGNFCHIIFQGMENMI